MKAAILHEPLKISIQKVPKPVVRRNDVLIKVKAVGLCGTDIETYRGSYNVKYPLIMGHEGAGEIVEVGEGVKNFRPKERVVIDPILHCKKCPMCLSGKTNLCKNGGLLGRDVGDGAYAEFVAVDQNMVFPFGNEISYSEAALIELLATVIHAQLRVSINPKIGVAILGQGPAGLLHTKLAKLTQAYPIIVTSRSEWKLRLALEAGADIVVNSSKEDPTERILKETNGNGAEVVIEAAGSQDTLNQASKIVSAGGTILRFGTVTRPMNNYDIVPLYLKEVNTIGSRACVQDDIKQAIKLANSGVVSLKPLITNEFLLDDIEEAFLAQDKLSRNLKTIIKPHDLAD